MGKKCDPHNRDKKCKLQFSWKISMKSDHLINTDWTILKIDLKETAHNGMARKELTGLGLVPVEDPHEYGLEYPKNFLTSSVTFSFSGSLLHRVSYIHLSIK